MHASCGFLLPGRLAALACGLALLSGGCGGTNDAEVTEAVAKSQGSASSDWAKAKAEGKDKSAVPARTNANSGYGGHVNKPGG